MDVLPNHHCYEILFDERGLYRKIVFEAADRSALFTDHCRVAGTYEILEDGKPLGRASYCEDGFWTLFGSGPG